MGGDGLFEFEDGDTDDVFDAASWAAAYAELIRGIEPLLTGTADDRVLILKLNGLHARLHFWERRFSELSRRRPGSAA